MVSLARTSASVLLLLIVAGCASYSMVGSGTHSLKGMKVTTDTAWNKAPSNAVFGGRQTWTQDGLMLNQLTFFEGIEDGDTLYKVSKKEEFPPFTSDLLAHEIMEIFEASLSKLSQTSVASTANLKPMTFGGHSGFRFEYSYVAADDVARQGMAAAAVVEDKLYMISFEAPTESPSLGPLKWPPIPGILLRAAPLNWLW